MAAVNRHSDDDFIYSKNVELVNKLIDSLESTDTQPHVLYSSSTQEFIDNPYGRSKRKGRELLIQWAEKNNAPFTGMILPNVFGPFCKPFYNSVIATFCHQLTHHEEPKVIVDTEQKLIYVNDLVQAVNEIIEKGLSDQAYNVEPTGILKVSDTLEKLKRFRDIYFLNRVIPPLTDNLELALFNTYRSYIDTKGIPFELSLKSDDRGYLVELIKENTGGQAFFSTTKPGITRGNHYHTRKIERFCVVKGEAVIKLRRIGNDEITEFRVTGAKPVIIDMPVFYTHNITNKGNSELLTIFWSHEIFNPDDPDTFYEEV
jgi:UDP-2-acetamido-2,6-beta-L-arabino-hexul-4-ose reductase